MVIRVRVKVSLRRLAEATGQRGHRVLAGGGDLVGVRGRGWW